MPQFSLLFYEGRRKKNLETLCMTNCRSVAVFQRAVYQIVSWYISVVFVSNKFTSFWSRWCVFYLFLELKAELFVTCRITYILCIYIVIVIYSLSLRLEILASFAKSTVISDPPFYSFFCSPLFSVIPALNPFFLFRENQEIILFPMTFFYKITLTSNSFNAVREKSYLSSQRAKVSMFVCLLVRLK